MTNTTHTPGPWSLSKPSGIYIDAPTGCIAALNYGALEGDARLIAAAPDLLAALERLEAQISQTSAYDFACRGDDPELLADVGFAREAIAKAKGA